jgi:GntR family transcriptional regulator
MITFRLDANSGVPIYRQIQDQIRVGIASGLLRPGEQLPTVRGLAVDLRVNPNTVIRAYTELEREGVLTTEQGSGTFIGSPPAEMTAAQRQAKLTSLCGEFLAQAARYGFAPAEVVRAIRGLMGGGTGHDRS